MIDGRLLVATQKVLDSKPHTLRRQGHHLGAIASDTCGVNGRDIPLSVNSLGDLLVYLTLREASERQPRSERALAMLLYMVRDDSWPALSRWQHAILSEVIPSVF